MGAGGIGSNDGRVRLYFRDQIPLLRRADPVAAVRAGAGSKHSRS